MAVFPIFSLLYEEWMCGSDTQVLNAQCKKNKKMATQYLGMELSSENGYGS